MPRDGARTAPRAPQACSLPADLATLDATTLVWEDEAAFEAVELTGTAPAGVTGRHLKFADSRIRATLGSAKLAGLHLVNVEIRGADLANAAMAGGGLQRARIAGTRMTGAALSEASLRDVALADTRLDLASFAEARLDRVAFVGCDLREASFSEARLRDVRFERCDLSGAEFHRAALQRVELAGCELTGLRSLSDLRGATLPWPDIVGSAGLFAAALGIGVTEDE